MAWLQWQTVMLSTLCDFVQRLLSLTGSNHLLYPTTMSREFTPSYSETLLGTCRHHSPQAKKALTLSTSAWHVASTVFVSQILTTNAQTNAQQLNIELPLRWDRAKTMASSLQWTGKCCWQSARRWHVWKNIHSSSCKAVKLQHLIHNIYTTNMWQSD